MSTDDSLGGRVPLLAPEQLDPDQRALYDAAMKTVVVAADKTGYSARTADDRLIGPFNPMLFSPKVSSVFLELQKTESSTTSLSGRARQVVILSVGAVWKAPYELYAHTAEARAAGLGDAAIEAVRAGQPHVDLRDDERLAQAFALAVVSDRRVDDALFAAARQAFQDKGLLDMLVLIACYQNVCSVLNVFAIPAPAR